LSQIDVEDLHTRLGDGKIRVLDVRRESEWQAGHITQADWAPLDYFSSALPDLDRDAPLAVHCKGGYRSMIACSLLQRAGYRNVINVQGGFDAWQKAQLPLATPAPVEA
jgi:hydroxyacylglutathione hydrolase